MFDFENEFIKGKRFSQQAALQNGFRFLDNAYCKEQTILQGEFELRISISENGILSTSLIEKETGTVYVNHKIEGANGEFVGKIRTEFISVLKEVVLAVYEDCLFATMQAERIVAAIKVKYGDDPEYLWKDDDDDRVFRNQENKKWYGIIMRLPGEKFQKKGQIEVLNVKLDPEDVARLSQEKGYAPAYHMSKTHWLSIFLDDEIDDKNILRLIEISHNFTLKKGKK